MAVTFIRDNSLIRAERGAKMGYISINESGSVLSAEHIELLVASMRAALARSAAGLPPTTIEKVGLLVPLFVISGTVDYQNCPLVTLVIGDDIIHLDGVQVATLCDELLPESVPGTDDGMV